MGVSGGTSSLSIEKMNKNNKLAIAFCSYYVRAPAEC